jgi:imidazole glycerol-phosphate synthase subunit HisF
MLAKRIIPCLDIRDGRTVKGIQFKSLRDAGDPIDLALKYCSEGADELVFLDISATESRRKTQLEWVNAVAKAIQIPFTVGGGINSVESVEKLLHTGADKISINSAALDTPKLIDDIANRYGNQCVVVAIDAKFENNDWYVYQMGGKIKTQRTLFEWSREVADRGAGEILFTSMTHDGTKSGFAVEALAKLNQQVNVPIIASGGAGSMKDFSDAFLLGKADAALAASVFHFGEIGIQELKSFLSSKKISVRF